MAKLKKSSVIIRFGFGQTNVKGRQRTDDTYRYVVRQIAFNFAEAEYDTLRKELQEGVKLDVQRELVNMASLYRRHIVGANGNTTKPAGIIRSVIGGADPLTIASVLPPWAPRSAKYLQRKANAGAGSGWFDNRGWQRQKGQTWSPNDTGLLFDSMRADVWESIFGPVSVRFRRDLKADAATTNITFKGKDRVQMQIGKLYVYALGKITPAMLPALNMKDGKIPIASDKGNPRLIGLVYDYDPELGKRLGNTSRGDREGVRGPYRPTLEPFLSYFLTRSIPAAVTRRIKEGSLARIVKGR